MNNVLIAKERTDLRKSALHHLREKGNIPAVVYGRHEESKSIAVNNLDFLKVIKDVGRNGIISLDVNGNKENVILADYQLNPINRAVIHADFLHINLSTEVHAQVHVMLTGSSESVENGGVLQQALHELNIIAKPKEIPESIEVDITNIKINHAIKIGEIRKNYSNITINHSDDDVIVTVIASRVENASSEQLDEEKEVQATV
ncbi:50S ribosomal protein L25/general stress protein Ctc [Bacillus sp. 1NLA3E]|uniref:50S ribosomal protein L25/general stress protein Ctc n=1 Tax=Bacillus sp. 1NLA3E TaxID=666686 RepID=UPI000247EE82|nr:50S ribosomal protein L25/general stress protein Ctc [Bacillus sp. 1NLA3E]AGK53583.1 50S ribosomal protein L25/general stress protein Ctc [Bacillus sp. 1NLA3E]